MHNLFFILGTLFGICIGSFCNVLIVRLHEGSGIGGRSRCVRCRRTLRWQHLIPIYSWLALRGRCAFCRRPIHWQYPAVEAAGGLIGVVTVAAAFNGTQGAAAQAVLTGAFLFALLVIAAFDLRWQLVPMEVTVGAGIVLGGWSIAISGGASLVSVLLGASATALLLWAIVAFSRGRLMGDGDPAVGFLVGAALGWPRAPIALALAFMVGGIVAAILLILRRVRHDTAVPFVPFFAIGAVMAYFWGDRILTYLTL